MDAIQAIQAAAVIVDSQSTIEEAMPTIMVIGKNTNGGGPADITLVQAPGHVISALANKGYSLHLEDCGLVVECW